MTVRLSEIRYCGFHLSEIRQKNPTAASIQGRKPAGPKCEPQKPFELFNSHEHSLMKLTADVECMKTTQANDAFLQAATGSTKFTRRRGHLQVSTELCTYDERQTA